MNHVFAALVGALLLSSAAHATKPAVLDPAKLASLERDLERAAWTVLGVARYMDLVRHRCEIVLPDTVPAIRDAERTWLAEHRPLMLSAEFTYGAGRSGRDKALRKADGIAEDLMRETFADVNASENTCRSVAATFSEPYLRMIETPVARAIPAMPPFTPTTHHQVDLMSRSDFAPIIASLQGKSVPATTAKLQPGEFRDQVVLNVPFDREGLPEGNISVAQSSGDRRIDRAVVNWAKRLRFNADPEDASAQMPPRVVALPIDLTPHD